MALVGGPDVASDWGSLLADLTRSDRGPSWRVHDRMHLEFSIDYLMGNGAPTQGFEWDAYFFVPESLRLHNQTYQKHYLYDDLQSYVRYAVPRQGFDELAGAPLERIRSTIASGADSAVILRELRLFACEVRSAGRTAQRGVLSLLEHPAGATETAADAALDVVRIGQSLVNGLRAAIAPIRVGDGELAGGVRWVDEDISRVMETYSATLAIELGRRGVAAAVVDAVASFAVEEACYREREALDTVGHADASEDEVEHLEFRRNVLKRFTASVLWLTLEVRSGAQWALHIFHALAAGLAMAIALTAAFFHGTHASGSLFLWALAVVAAYALKDRVKALLQAVFADVVSRYFPDRRWRILDRERDVELGRVHERSGFVSNRRLPPQVLALRRSARRHDFENDARPERVLWHHKRCVIRADRIAQSDSRFDALTEIFRLNMTRWIENTDDPKRKVYFADPEDRHVYSAVARRVYNIAVIFRLRRDGDQEASWHRLRLVVTRRGILRIEPIC